MPDITRPAPELGILAQRMGMALVEASPQRTVATMPVAGNTQPYGLLNGGASAALAETVGSVAADLHAGPGRGAVGIELNASHHRGVRSGSVTATATALHLGRRTASYEVVVVDDDGARVCTARLTCLVIDLGGGAGGHEGAGQHAVGQEGAGQHAGGQHAAGQSPQETAGP